MIRACDTGRDPTGSRPAVTPQHTPTIGISAKKLAQHTPSSGISAKKLAQHARKRGFGVIFRALGELFRARTLTRPSRANFFAHRTRPRANFETNDTSAATDAGQHETADTTATEKCTKYSFFSPAKAMRFQPHARTSEQRRRRFQESGPSGLQDPDAIPVAGGGAWPGDQWAADVTNVVKPTRFKSPHEGPCYKRRQSKPKNHHYQRKSH